MASLLCHNTAAAAIIRTSSGESWATIHDGAGTSHSHTYPPVDILCGASGGLYTKLSRVGMTFDTHYLGASAEISSAVLTVGIQSGILDQLGGNLDLVLFSPGDPTAYVNGDYSNFGTVVFSTKDITTLSPLTYYDFTLNADGLAAINKTGYTCLGFRISWDTSNIEPSWGASKEEYVEFEAFFTGQIDLTIEYTTPAVNTQKGLAYKVQNHPAAKTKGLTYAVPSTPAAKTKGMTYVVRNSVPLSKSMQYVVKKAVKDQPGLAYKVLATPAAKTRSLIYFVRAVTAAKTKGLVYTIPTTPAAKTKTILYLVKTTPSAKSLSMAYQVPPAAGQKQIGMVYVVRLPDPSTISHRMGYRILHIPPAQTRALVYKLLNTLPTSKDMAYMVPTTPAAGTKGLLYLVYFTPVELQADMEYRIGSTTGMSLGMQYYVKTSENIGEEV